jgi:hypothetical protein
MTTLSSLPVEVQSAAMIAPKRAHMTVSTLLRRLETNNGKKVASKAVQLDRLAATKLNSSFAGTTICDAKSAESFIVNAWL